MKIQMVLTKLEINIAAYIEQLLHHFTAWKRLNKSPGKDDSVVWISLQPVQEYHPIFGLNTYQNQIFFVRQDEVLEPALFSE